MARAKWDKREKAMLPVVVDKRRQGVPWETIERWWKETIGTNRGRQALRAKMDRWVLEKSLKELTALKSVQKADGVPPSPTKDESRSRRDTVLGVRSKRLVGKPYRSKAKCSGNRSEWSVPSSPNPPSTVGSPGRRLRELHRPAEQVGSAERPAIATPTLSTSIAAWEDSSLWEPNGKPIGEPITGYYKDIYSSCVAYCMLTKQTEPISSPPNVAVLPHRPRRRQSDGAIESQQD